MTIANLRQCVEASEAKDKYIKQLEMQADRMRAQIAAKDAALEWYADTISKCNTDKKAYNTLNADGGELARTMLK